MDWLFVFVFCLVCQGQAGAAVAVAVAAVFTDVILGLVTPFTDSFRDLLWFISRFISRGYIKVHSGVQSRFPGFFRVIPRNVFQEVLGHFLLVFACLRFLRVCVFACLRVCVLVGFVILFCDCFAMVFRMLSVMVFVILFISS